MNTNSYFKQHESKLKFEAIVKSTLSGLAIGFGANFVTALVTWFFAINGLWISLGVCVGVSTITAIVFYFKRFRPTDISNARRIDRVGLHERLVTMVEYENDNSCIAKLQREDAKRALASINKKQIKAQISKTIVVAAIICILLGTGMTTINVLGELGYISSGEEILDNFIPKKPEQFISVTYDVEEGGAIEGEADQLILLGEDAAPVVAVPDDGYAFVQWSDGSTKPYRTDKELEADMEVFAIFEAANDEGDGGDGEGDGAGEGSGDGEGDGEGNGDGSGNGEGDGEGNGDGSGQGEGDGHGNTGGGKYEHANQIINGETYYREVLDEYRDQLEEYLEKNRDNLTPEEIEVIEQYIGIV